MTAPFESVAEIINYIQSHRGQYGFAPERITLSPKAYKDVVHRLDGISLYATEKRLYGFITFMGTRIEQGQAKTA